MIDSLLASLQPNQVLLTPNQRLAATLLKRYNQLKADQGLRCWATPNIRPLGSWLEETWHQACAQHLQGELTLLSSNQELILWEETIAEFPESEFLLKLSDLAKQAKSAWSTLKHWRVAYQHPAFAAAENSRYFQKWAQAFEQRCQKNGWIDQASLMDLLISDLEQQKLDLPSSLIFYQFTEFTPQAQAFLAAAEKRGIQIHIIEAPQPTNTIHQLGLSDENQEIQLMTAWAKTMLDQNPGAVIGCIADNLEEKREALVSQFEEVFSGPEFYNISAGRTLASYPMIQQALELLSLSAHSISGNRLSALLHSPFIGDADREMVKRLQLDAQLRRRNLNTLKWPLALAEIQGNDCPKLHQRLLQYLEHRQKQASSQKISAWVQDFALLLENLGWPGEKSLNSQEYQVVKQWLNLLLETAALDTILPELSFSKALHYLSVLAVKSYFQPESPDAPIQILGQLEAAGLPFDYVWVMGMTDTAWPAAPSPNPLIPHELQKNLKMPNASANRQLQYSQRLRQQFNQASRRVIYSFAQHQEQESQKPSPLIVEYPLLSAQELKLPFSLSKAEQVFNSRLLETLLDEQAPPLSHTEKVRGGVSIFEMQAACPFKAFAKLRLNAQPLDEAQAGLPAKSRGSIVHKALEIFWRETQSQSNLLALTPDALNERIKTVVRQAIEQTADFIDAQSLFNSLVSQRLENTLSEWLQLEKKRPPFRVAALEEEKIFEINQFPIRMRLDRIDELLAEPHRGEKLIIDYKTKKKCEPKSWFGARPDEPQLPLYCVSSSDSISGLAFGQIHSNKTSLIGLSASELEIAEVKPITEKTKADALSWDEQVQSWRQHLNQLFQDFQAGKATVDPKTAVTTCRYCEVQSLCRVHEQMVSYDE